jgi:AmpD protein
MNSNEKLFRIDDQGFIENLNKIQSPNFDCRPKNTDIDLLVIHSISLPPNQFGGNYIEDFFQNKLDLKKHSYFKTIKELKVSSHFLIKRSGELIQFVSCNNRAWHAGESSWKHKSNCNDFSIGIELEGTDHEPFEDNQYMKLINLIKCLCKNYPISDIVGHNQIAPQRKTDPGPLFNWNLINLEKIHEK